MRYLQRLFFLLLGFIFFQQHVVAQIHRLDGSQTKFSELDKRVQTLVDKAKVTGFTLTIFNEDTVFYQKTFGYSNYDAKATLSVNQVFYGASLSKAVFGYLVAQLTHKGIIDLDKPLQDYLDVPIPALKFEKEWRGFTDLTGMSDIRKSPQECACRTLLDFQIGDG